MSDFSDYRNDMLINQNLPQSEQSQGEEVNCLWHNGTNCTHVKHERTSCRLKDCPDFTPSQPVEHEMPIELQIQGTDTFHPDDRHHCKYREWYEKALPIIRTLTAERDAQTTLILSMENHVDCPFCSGRGEVGIPGAVCLTCKGTGANPFRRFTWEAVKEAKSDRDRYADALREIESIHNNRPTFVTGERDIGWYDAIRECTKIARIALRTEPPTTSEATEEV